MTIILNFALGVCVLLLAIAFFFAMLRLILLVVNSILEEFGTDCDQLLRNIIRKIKLSMGVRPACLDCKHWKETGYDQGFCKCSRWCFIREPYFDKCKEYEPIKLEWDIEFTIEKEDNT